MRPGVPTPIPPKREEKLKNCTKSKFKALFLVFKTRKQAEEKRKREVEKRTGEGPEGRRALEAAWKWWGEGTTVSSSAQRSGP
jgi:hypothetical protein